jgi:hypothetical protein
MEWVRIVSKIISFIGKQRIFFYVLQFSKLLFKYTHVELNTGPLSPNGEKQNCSNISKRLQLHFKVHYRQIHINQILTIMKYELFKQKLVWFKVVVKKSWLLHVFIILSLTF